MRLIEGKFFLQCSVLVKNKVAIRLKNSVVFIDKYKPVLLFPVFFLVADKCN